MRLYLSFILLIGISVNASASSFGVLRGTDALGGTIKIVNCGPVRYPRNSRFQTNDIIIKNEPKGTIISGFNGMHVVIENEYQQVVPAPVGEYSLKFQRPNGDRLEFQFILNRNSEGCTLSWEEIIRALRN